MVNIESIANMVTYYRSRVKLELKSKADDADDTIVSIDRSAKSKKMVEHLDFHLYQITDL